MSLQKSAFSRVRTRCAEIANGTRGTRYGRARDTRGTPKRHANRPLQNDHRDRFALPLLVAQRPYQRLGGRIARHPRQHASGASVGVGYCRWNNGDAGRTHSDGMPRHRVALDEASDLDNAPLSSTQRDCVEVA